MTEARWLFLSRRVGFKPGTVVGFELGRRGPSSSLRVQPLLVERSDPSAGGDLDLHVRSVKSDAGQYLTSRLFIQAIVDVMQPIAANRVADPAAGTGGFLLFGYEHMKTDFHDLAAQSP